MKFADLVDIEELKYLLNSFTEATGAVTAILELDGEILVATGWQDICTQFHRQNPGTAKRCLESDTALADKLAEGESYNVYQCKNGLVDVAVPIMVAGQHVANLFTGQFFFQQPNVVQFAKQAEQFSFDQARYIDALNRVPIFTEAEIKSLMNFLTVLAKLFGEMGLARLELLKTNERSKKEQSFLKALVDTIPDLVWIKDPDGVYLRCNHRFEKLYGDSAANIIGRTDFDYVDKELAEFFRKHDRLAMLNGKWTNEETLKFAADGHEEIVETTKVSMVDEDGNLVGVLGIGHDITDRKNFEESIKQYAFFDPLTNLPNRRLMMDRLQQAILSVERTGQFGALILLDLDNFKAVNDTLGHDIGDKLLNEVVLRLNQVVRRADTVSRFGGDEFVIILEGLGGTDDSVFLAEEIAEKIRVVLSAPYSIESASVLERVQKKTLYCTPSIGIVMFNNSSLSPDELLKRADTAMYKAKADGKNAWRFFDPQMQRAVERRAELESALRNAIFDQSDELRLWVQPQVNIEGKIIGVESLIRWMHPTKGFVSPTEFIPLAEDTGLIIPLGHQILQMACNCLSEWSQHALLKDILFSVNISPRQVALPNFSEDLLSIIQETEAPANKLELEITETLLHTNLEGTIKHMTYLKNFGIHFSMDDFGTGYSSLSYLKRLPLNKLKIDQSFVHDLTEDENSKMIAQTIVTLGNSLGLDTIAEGVETEEQRDLLTQIGCTNFQGHFYAQPMPIEEFLEWIKTQNLDSLFTELVRSSAGMSVAYK